MVARELLNSTHRRSLSVFGGEAANPPSPVHAF